MENTYNKALSLVWSSKKEALLYLAVSTVSAGLYLLICRAFGVANAYDTYSALKTSPAKSLLALLPEVILTAWIAAGLAGRFTTEVLTGTPGELTRYANGWFLRKLTADTLFTGVMIAPALLLVVVPFASAVAALAWIIVAAWFGIRISLWLNASVAENLGFVEALQKSFTITEWHAPRLLIISGAPMLAAGGLKWALGKALPAQSAALFFSRSVIDGAAALLLMGLLAVLYLEMKTAKKSAPQPAAEPQQAT